MFFWVHVTQIIPAAPWADEGRRRQPCCHNQLLLPSKMKKASKRGFQLLFFFPNQVMKVSHEDHVWQDREEFALGFWVVSALRLVEACGFWQERVGRWVAQEISMAESWRKGLSSDRDNNVMTPSDPQSYLIFYLPLHWTPAPHSLGSGRKGAFYRHGCGSMGRAAVFTKAMVWGL